MVKFTIKVVFYIRIRLRKFDNIVGYLSKETDVALMSCVRAFESEQRIF